MALLSFAMARVWVVLAAEPAHTEPVFTGGMYDTREVRLCSVSYLGKADFGADDGQVEGSKRKYVVFVTLRDSKGASPTFAFISDLRSYSSICDAKTFDVLYLASMNCYQINGKDAAGKLVYASQLELKPAEVDKSNHPKDKEKPKKPILKAKGARPLIV